MALQTERIFSKHPVPPANRCELRSTGPIHKALNPGQPLNEALLWSIEQTLDRPYSRAIPPTPLPAVMEEGKPDKAGR